MSDFNQVLPTIEIVKTAIVILIIPTALKYFESQYLSDVAQKKNVWNNFIREQGSIKDCFERYNKIQLDSECGFPFLYIIFIASVVSVFLILFLSLVVSSFLFEPIQSNSYLTGLRVGNNITLNNLFLVITSFLFLLSSFIPILLSKKLKNYVFIEENEVVNKYHKVKQIYSIVVIFSSVLLLWSVNLLLIFNEFFNIIIICAVLLFLISVYFSTLNNNDYTQRISISE